MPTNRRSLVVIAAGSQSGSHGFESSQARGSNTTSDMTAIFFCDQPQHRVSSTQAQWVGKPPTEIHSLTDATLVDVSEL